MVSNQNDADFEVYIVYTSVLYILQECYSPKEGSKKRGTRHKVKYLYGVNQTSKRVTICGPDKSLTTIISLSTIC